MCLHFCMLVALKLNIFILMQEQRQKKLSLCLKFLIFQASSIHPTINGNMIFYSSNIIFRIANGCHNFIFFAKASNLANTDVMAVVKADCYSNGINIACFIEEYVCGFAVANVFEGVQLRELGIKKPILALSFKKSMYFGIPVKLLNYINRLIKFLNLIICQNFILRINVGIYSCNFRWLEQA